jgi:hypothetical protein
VENLSDRSPCHARESGESSWGLATFSASKKLPVPFPEAGFRLALPRESGDHASLAGMTSESVKAFQEQPNRSIAVRNLAKFTVLLLFLLAVPSVVRAQSLSLAERQKIEALIQYVGGLKDAHFIRNGSSYEVSTAVRFLRGKWEANESGVKTARDFIDKVASVSGTSGKPYLIRFRDGSETKSQDFLHAELKKIEKPAAEQSVLGTKSTDPPSPPPNKAP